MSRHIHFLSLIVVALAAQSWAYEYQDIFREKQVPLTVQG